MRAWRSLQSRGERGDFGLQLGESLVCGVGG